MSIHRLKRPYYSAIPYTNRERAEGTHRSRLGMKERAINPTTLAQMPHKTLIPLLENISHLRERPHCPHFREKFDINKLLVTYVPHEYLQPNGASVTFEKGLMYWRCHCRQRRKGTEPRRAVVKVVFVTSDELAQRVRTPPTGDNALEMSPPYGPKSARTGR